MERKRKSKLAAWDRNWTGTREIDDPAPNQVRHLWRSPSVFPGRKTLSLHTNPSSNRSTSFPALERNTGSGDYIGITDVGDWRLVVGDWRWRWRLRLESGDFGMILS